MTRRFERIRRLRPNLRDIRPQLPCERCDRGWIRNTASVEPLVRLLDDKNDRVQVNAVRALSALNDRRAVEPLMALGEKLLERHDDNFSDRRMTDTTGAALLEIITALGAIKD